MSTAQGSEGPGSGSSAGSPGDALPTLAAALVSAAEAKPTSTADPNVSAAFALGWHMSELYKLSQGDTKPAKDLPGLGSLLLSERETILIDQIEVNTDKLNTLVEQAGMEGGIDLSKLTKAVTPADESDPVRYTHVQILGSLTAADFRLGKAYGLGRALADTCREPTNPQELRAQLDPPRISNLLRWLDDLSTMLPEHAADSVSKSLTSWRDAANPRDSPAKPRGWKRFAGWWHGDRRHRKPPPTLGDDERAVHTLRRQGEIWRALLSDEKAGTDMLEINNYLDAVREMASQIGAIARGVMSRMPVLTALVLAFLVAGISLIAAGGSSQIAGGATSLLVAFGLTWRGLGATAGKLIGKLEQPLWGAVLDDAIADAITLLPAAKAEGFGRRQVAFDASDQREADQRKQAKQEGEQRPATKTSDDSASSPDPATLPEQEGEAKSPEPDVGNGPSA